MNNDPPHSTLCVIRVSDVEVEAVEYLWNGRIARRQVTLITGVPGGGKSQISCDVGARITTGAAWPDIVVGMIGRSEHQWRGDCRPDQPLAA
jgi:hypothetical protein